MLDYSTKKPDKVTPIGDVTFVSMDEKNAKVFSFISNNKALNIMTCYNYKCSTNSSTVVVDINDAFAISNGKQPHPPKVGPRKRMSQEEAAKLSRKQSVRVCNLSFEYFFVLVSFFSRPALFAEHHFSVFFLPARGFLPLHYRSVPSPPTPSLPHHTSIALPPHRPFSELRLRIGRISTPLY